MSKKSKRSGDGQNLLFLGDAARVCELLAGRSERLELIYLDPPYSVGSTMHTRDRRGQARGRKQARSGRDAYDDRDDVETLIQHLEPRLAAVRDLLSDRGALYLHLDHRAVHEAKVAADRVFGRPAFAGEIIWTPGNGCRGARGFAVTHQTILVYARRRRNELLFQVDHPLLREPYAKTSLKMHFKHEDRDGRRYRERTIRGKTYRYYADQGRRIGSVWTDAPAMVANTPLRRESTGYPTQKPCRLLERIIRASSRVGDTVADLMCGSGTTLDVAAATGRRFIGGDSSPIAIEITRQRLDEAAVGYRFEEACDADSRAASAMAPRMPRSAARPEPARS